MKQRIATVKPRGPAMRRLSAALCLAALMVPPGASAQPAGPLLPLGINADLGGRRLLPDDSPWHRDVSRDPIDPYSARILERIGFDTPLHADFGTVWEGKPIGIPYMIVSRQTSKVPILFTKWPEESDPGPYPIPPDAPIEGGPDSKDDRHVLVFDRDSWTAYELFNAFPEKGGWKAANGAKWDFEQNQIRPPGWTSADAAGLPILPALVRYDEVIGKGAIHHALRFSLAKTRKAYVPPASHWASEETDPTLPPMGMRVRLRADFDLTGFSAEARVVLQAIKTYGMFLADNGSDFFITGAPDPRWNDDALRDLRRVRARDLEIVQMDGIVTPPK